MLLQVRLRIFIVRVRSIRERPCLHAMCLTMAFNATALVLSGILYTGFGILALPMLLNDEQAQ